MPKKKQSTNNTNKEIIDLGLKNHQFHFKTGKEISEIFDRDKAKAGHKTDIAYFLELVKRAPHYNEILFQLAQIKERQTLTDKKLDQILKLLVESQ